MKSKACAWLEVWPGEKALSEHGCLSVRREEFELIYFIDISCEGYEAFPEGAAGPNRTPCLWLSNQIRGGANPDPHTLSQERWELNCCLSLCLWEIHSYKNLLHDSLTNLCNIYVIVAVMKVLVAQEIGGILNWWQANLVKVQLYLWNERETFREGERSVAGRPHTDQPYTSTLWWGVYLCSWDI